MKTIDVKETPVELEAILDDASSEDIVIRLPDGRLFFLASFDDFDNEILQTRRNQALMETLKHRSQSTGTTHSAGEVRAKLGL